MRISSIECGRVVAIMAVMTIHLSPFSNPFDPTLWNDALYLWLGGIINQLCRFAVPLFFLCAGYFLQPALAAGNPMTAALRYCRPLLGLWLVWSLIYLLMPFNPLAAIEQGYLPAMASQWQMQLGDPLNAWWVGGMIHLWFLPALMLAVLCHRIGLPRLALVLGGLLYLLALLGGSYGQPLLGGEWALLTRNGPFFSLLFVALGAELRARHWRPDTRRSVLLLGVGMGIYALEAWGLLHFADVPLSRHDFLLGSLPWGLGLFGLLLANQGWGQGSWLERQAPWVLGLYCLHMMLVVWLMIFGPQGKLLWWELMKVPVLITLSLLAYRLLAATPASRCLLRAR
ncbi:fucose 4-O-acetylase [Aeromonas salmonicida subsp. achromogenes]|uniref:acyltransferase n=1 Tax=Aeromonas salmonicida TaxID=645 RepID=UPI00110FE752|nr:acyltransferase family protein [Aeromonas salmonicida]TMX09731.1 fucose 4-O-acetylase [Aeromonas salmonicida subsp. achromogenes]TMX11997.1 fucose 4-O-acetylase [Aeromonas salmonicida subsp. achromogenes]TMX12562.1 fucose 4-O-acetylase [Aeromonas salmonicida subsp. achromogenes]TMX19238.1 fucose 4-O-acetylase [Aeromonas salmonicida subsp. achromogenes]